MKGKIVKAKPDKKKGNLVDIPPMPKDEEATKMIQFRVAPPREGKGVYKTAQRQFDKVEDADAYWQALTKEDILKSMSENGRAISLTSGATVVTNYDIRRIYNKMTPPRLLPEIFASDKVKFIRPEPSKDEPTAAPPKPAPEKPVTKAAAKEEKKEAKVSGELVPLKAICREINVEPREARVKLRAAVKKKTIKDPGGRWEWPKTEVDQIKSIIA